MGQYAGRFCRVCLDYVNAVTGYDIDEFTVRFDNIGLIYASYLEYEGTCDPGTTSAFTCGATFR